jgi:DNA repair protein RadC
MRSLSVWHSGGVTFAFTMSDLPSEQRPRERLRAHGPDALSDAELVALLLGTGRVGVNAVDLATQLLVAHGGIGGLRHADVTALSHHPGVGTAKATRLVAALALAMRVTDAVDSRPTIAGSSDIATIAASRFADQRRERVVLLVCGPRNTVLDVVLLSDGTAHSATFPIRQLLAEVLRRDGTAFALAHNHPSGDATPSNADRRTTSALRQAANDVGLRMLDHVVVAGSEWRSVTAIA